MLVKNCYCVYNSRTYNTYDRLSSWLAFVLQAENVDRCNIVRYKMLSSDCVDMAQVHSDIVKVALNSICITRTRHDRIFMFATMVKAINRISIALSM